MQVQFYANQTHFHMKVLSSELVFETERKGNSKMAFRLLPLRFLVCNLFKQKLKLGCELDFKISSGTPEKSDNKMRQIYHFTVRTFTNAGLIGAANIILSFASTHLSRCFI